MKNKPYTKGWYEKVANSWREGVAVFALNGYKFRNINQKALGLEVLKNTDQIYRGGEQARALYLNCYKKINEHHYEQLEEDVFDDFKAWFSQNYDPVVFPIILQRPVPLRFDAILHHVEATDKDPQRWRDFDHLTFPERQRKILTEMVTILDGSPNGFSRSFFEEKAHFFGNLDLEKFSIHFDLTHLGVENRPRRATGNLLTSSASDHRTDKLFYFPHVGHIFDDEGSTVFFSDEVPRLTRVNNLSMATTAVFDVEFEGIAMYYQASSLAFSATSLPALKTSAALRTAGISPGALKGFRDANGQITLTGLTANSVYELQTVAQFLDSNLDFHSDIDRHVFLTAPTLGNVSVVATNLNVTPTFPTSGGTLYWTIREGDPDFTLSKDDIADDHDAVGSLPSGRSYRIAATTTGVTRRMSALQLLPSHKYTMYAFFQRDTTPTLDAFKGLRSEIAYITRTTPAS